MGFASIAVKEQFLAGVSNTVSSSWSSEADRLAVLAQGCRALDPRSSLERIVTVIPQLTGLHELEILAISLMNLAITDEVLAANSLKRTIASLPVGRSCTPTTLDWHTLFHFWSILLADNSGLMQRREVMDSVEHLRRTRVLPTHHLSRQMVYLQQAIDREDAQAAQIFGPSLAGLMMNDPDLSNRTITFLYNNPPAGAIGWVADHAFIRLLRASLLSSERPDGIVPDGYMTAFFAMLALTMIGTFHSRERDRDSQDRLFTSWHGALVTQVSSVCTAQNSIEVSR